MQLSEGRKNKYHLLELIKLIDEIPRYRVSKIRELHKISGKEIYLDRSLHEMMTHHLCRLNLFEMGRD